MLAAVLAAPAPAARAAGGGNTFAFLLTHVDARPVALGGAYTALADDSSALFYNPAGLADQERHNASFTHNKHFQGVNQEVLSMGLRSGWGVGVNYLSYGKIPRTTVSQPTGAGQGTFGASDLAVSFGHGRRLNGTVSLGGALKYVRSEIAGFSATGVALDVGTKVELEPIWEVPVTLGLSIQNVGLSQPKFATRKESFPTYIRLGVAYRAELTEEQAVVAVLDLNREVSDEFTVHPGLEWRIRKVIAFRIGYNGRNDAGSGAAGGLAFAYKDLGISYAFVPFGDLGDSHRISLSLRWGEGRSVARTSRAPKHSSRRKIRPRRSIMPARPTYFDTDKTIGG